MTILKVFDKMCDPRARLVENEDKRWSPFRMEYYMDGHWRKRRPEEVEANNEYWIRRYEERYGG
jgi:hypothetical protein